MFIVIFNNVAKFPKRERNPKPKTLNPSPNADPNPNPNLPTAAPLISQNENAT